MFSIQKNVLVCHGDCFFCVSGAFSFPHVYFDLCCFTWAWRGSRPQEKLAKHSCASMCSLFLYVAVYLILYETCVICSMYKFSSCVFCFRYGCLGPGMEPVWWMSCMHLSSQQSFHRLRLGPVECELLGLLRITLNKARPEIQLERVWTKQGRFHCRAELSDVDVCQSGRVNLLCGQRFTCRARKVPWMTPRCIG